MATPCAPSTHPAEVDQDRQHWQQLRREDVAEEVGVLAPARMREQASLVRRHVRSGRWQRLGATVVQHNGPVTPVQLSWAAVLSAGPLAALARSSALAAGGLVGVATSPVVVVVPFARTPAPLPGVRYVRSRHLGAVDLVAGSLLPRTTVARALVDEASRARRDRARTLVAMAVQQRRTTVPEVEAVLVRLAPVRQSVLLALTLQDVAGGSHSLPELRFVELVRLAGLPVPDRQVVRRRPDGRYVLDAHWERYGVTVEVDGGHHREVATWEADVLRQDELVLAGDAVVRVLSWWVRDRPTLVVDLVRRALLARGWQPSELHAA